MRKHLSNKKQVDQTKEIVEKYIRSMTYEWECIKLGLSSVGHMWWRANVLLEELSELLGVDYQSIFNEYSVKAKEEYRTSHIIYAIATTLRGKSTSEQLEILTNSEQFKTRSEIWRMFDFIRNNQREWGVNLGQDLWSRDFEKLLLKKLEEKFSHDEKEVKK